MKISPNKELTRCIWQGGFSQFSGLKEFLGGYLNLEPIFINPFQNFSLPSGLSPEAAQADSAFFSVAIGLALEEL